MNQVIIKRDGFYGCTWNSETRQDDIEKLDDIGCVRGLRCSVEIEDGVTFGDIIRTVSQSEFLTSVIGLYNHCSKIEEHHNYILNEPPEKETDLEYIEVSWYARVWKLMGEGKFEDSCDLEFWTCADGVGPNEEGERINWAIDLTPANQMKNLPVKLNKQVKIWLMRGKNGEPLDGKGVLLDENEKYPYIQAEHFFTLLELLDALYEEISFFGPPGGREQVVEKLHDAMEEAKAQVDDGTALPVSETEDGYKVYMGDQVREFFGLPSNEEDRDEQIRRSSEEE